MPEQPAPQAPASQQPKAAPPAEKSQLLEPRLSPLGGAEGNALGVEAPREGAGAPGLERSGVMPAIQLASGSALLHAAKLVDVGRARDHQEDAAGIFVPTAPELLARKGCLYVVADGMGGHNAGEIASQTALAEIQRIYYSSPEPDTPTALRQALSSANQTIQRFAQADSRQLGMGTTAAVAVVRGQDVHVANVGDSRVYLVRHGKATQITQDHSWVEEQVRAGVLTPEQARSHPQRNVITRALGTGAGVEPDLFAGVLQEGDVLVLNSDGLTGHVGAAELGEISGAYPPEQAARRLVDLANERGGSDNISVIVVRAEAPALVAATVAAGAEAPAAPPKLASAAGQRSRSGVMLIGLLAVVLLVVAIAAVLLLRKPPETPPTKEALSPTAGAPAAVLTSTVGIAAVAPITIPASAATQEIAVAAPGIPVSATATVTLAPTMSPTPTPSDTPTARPGRTITLQGVTPTNAAPGGATTPGAAASMPAPRLAGPPDGELVTANQSVTFTWDWDGRPGANQGFEVRIWREGAADHLGAAPPAQGTSQSIRVSGADGVKGQDGDYLWTAALVQLDPYRRIGAEAPFRRLAYRSSAGGEAPTNTPLPPPTNTPPPEPTNEPPPEPTNEPPPEPTTELSQRTGLVPSSDSPSVHSRRPPGFASIRLLQTPSPISLPVAMEVPAVASAPSSTPKVYLPFVQFAAPPPPLLAAIANEDGDGNYTASWTRTGITSTLQEATNLSFDGARAVYSGPATAYEATGKGAARYFYRARAFNFCCSSAWSNIQTVDVLVEAEPNNVYTQANGPLVSTLLYRGRFNPETDRNDYYFFDLAATGDIDVRLTHIAAGEDYDLVVRDDQGMVGYSGNVGNADERVYLSNMPAGRYYVRVYNGSGMLGQQDYQLRVAF